MGPYSCAIPDFAKCQVGSLTQNGKQGIGTSKNSRVEDAAPSTGKPIAACSGVRSASEVNPKRRLSRQRASQLSALLGQHLADSLHLRADSAQLFFDALVAAVDVVDAVDNRLAVRD